MPRFFVRWPGFGTSRRDETAGASGAGFGDSRHESNERKNVKRSPRTTGDAGETPKYANLRSLCVAKSDDPPCAGGLLEYGARPMRTIVLSLCIAVTACAVTTDREEVTTDRSAASVDVTFHDLSFSQYHSQDAVKSYLSNAASAHAGLVTFTKLGVSRQGREIDVIAISHRDPSTVPAIYFNGTHHGDEWSSTEGILGLADYLVTHHDEPAVKSTLDQYAIWLQPLVNPDGHDARTREDSQGNDPNRDYEYPTGNPSAAYRLPEIKLVRDLVARIKPRGAAAYHSGIEEVIWPWCYTGSDAPNAQAASTAGKIVADAMGFDRYLQSYDDYPTTGEFIDFTYSKYGALSLTFEVSTAKTPSAASLDRVVKNSVKGALAFIDTVKAVDSGTLPSTFGANTKGSEGKLGHRIGPRLE